MTDDRAAFEKWVTPRYGFELTRTEDGYRDFAINDEWEAWRAGMRAGIERAAGVCPAFLHTAPAEGGDDLDRIGRYSNGTVRRIEAAIRALLEGKT